MSDAQKMWQVRAFKTRPCFEWLIQQTIQYISNIHTSDGIQLVNLFVRKRTSAKEIHILIEQPGIISTEYICTQPIDR